MNLSTLETERRNARTADLDRLSVLELLSVMNAEYQTVAVGGDIRTAIGAD
ncbi:hypothetical protein [Mycobacterium goodii]|uniref:hypothetical protein n=1 Tax=Mycolicibacterium goodii TaxID=134601 RepID=UPI001951B798